jgi:hypothetical protein
MVTERVRAPFSFLRRAKNAGTSLPCCGTLRFLRRGGVEGAAFGDVFAFEVGADDGARARRKSAGLRLGRRAMGILQQWVQVEKA